MTLQHNAAICSSRDPVLAFRLLRRLHLAAALWGHRRALPIAILTEPDRIKQFRLLRILLELEREGALELHRVMRAIQLTDARAEMGLSPTAGVA